MNCKIAEIQQMVALFVSIAALAEAEPVTIPSAWIGRIWHSYEAREIEYDIFYRITVYRINSSYIHIGLLVGGDSNRVVWAYSEYEDGVTRHIVANRKVDESIERLLDKLQALEGRDRIDAGVLDGNSLVVEVLNKGLDATKTVRRRFNSPEAITDKESLEAMVFDLWNSIPETIKFRFGTETETDSSAE